MERHAFAMKVKAGRMNDYRKKPVSYTHLASKIMVSAGLPGAARHGMR